MFEISTLLWRSFPLALSFGVGVFPAGVDSISHFGGLLVAIERGRLSQGFDIGLPSLPETGFKTDMDARVLFVSSWMVNSVARRRGDDGEMPRPSILFSALLGTAILSFECGLDGSLAKESLDSARDGPCRDIDSESPLLWLRGRLSWILARNDRCEFN